VQGIQPGHQEIADEEEPPSSVQGEAAGRNHTGVNKSATDLVTKLKVKPENNPNSASLKSGGDENLKKLRGLSGSAFDKAYIDHEVTYHEVVIDAMDKTLIPSAKNALKPLLVKVRPAFDAHLAHAKQLQAALAK
jgi:putative membrane protein